MHPLICKIGPFPIYSFGVAMAVAVILCAYLLAAEAKRKGIDVDVIFDLVFWVVVSGIIGARIFFIVLNVEYFWEYPAEIFQVQNGGIAWQGGLIGGIVAGLIFIRKKKSPLWPTLDMAAPYLALGQAVGRVGCFFNGCCYGKEFEWGIYFPVHDATLHPAQLYDSLGLVLIFVILRILQDKWNKPGQIFISYLVLASTLRFCVEFVRADHQTLILGLSIFQVVTILVVSVSLFFASRLRRQWFS
jgi:phosphatidylglycerol:prolipoprotein diacylglycerol transferase